MYIHILAFFFFFSSRRRHTRFDCDWSSDVCSSDLPVGALCVRYVKIYFGMLTLAFGMVFYTFVLKFYSLTGGDEGLPFGRPLLLGRDLSAMPKTDYLTGPYYYYCVVVLVLATACMWRIVHSPFGLCLRTI